MNEFFIPIELAEIENPELRNMVAKAIGEKTKPIVFLDDEKKEIKFPDSRHTRSQLASWRNIVIEWAKDPYNPPSGIEGHGYEIFLREMLEGVIDPKYSVIHAPASVDFIDSADRNMWGPSADIIIGEWIKDKMKPVFLVGATLSNTKKGVSFHKNLNVPILPISELGYFPQVNGATFLFGTMNKPSQLIQQLAPSFKNSLTKILEPQGFLSVLKKNFYDIFRCGIFCEINDFLASFFFSKRTF
jgi:hypothetical protein